MKKIFEDLFDILKTIIIVLILAFLIRNFLFQPFVVEGQSMEPNLINDEYLLVNRLSYRIDSPKRGDVIVFQAPNNPKYDYIKRIIGLPGEEVEIKNNNIYINNQPLSENYINTENNFAQPKKNSNVKINLKQDEYFVLGDNRDHSSDSRDWGILPKNNIIGKAWLSLYPWNIFGFISRADYEI